MNRKQRREHAKALRRDQKIRNNRNWQEPEPDAETLDTDVSQWMSDEDEARAMRRRQRLILLMLIVTVMLLVVSGILTYVRH